MLKKLDPDRAKTIDAKNKVRLIRAIEICKTIGKVPKPSNSFEDSNRAYAFLQIGIDLPKEKLYSNIKKRLQQRFNEGMIEEVERLHYKDKISWKRLESFGLGYTLIPKFLKACLPASPKLQRGEPKRQDEITSREELFERIYQAEKDYSKRQMTWFRKDKRIIWLETIKVLKKK